MAKPPNLGTIIAVAKKIIRWVSRTPVRTLADDMPPFPPRPWKPPPHWTETIDSDYAASIARLKRLGIITEDMSNRGRGIF